MKVPKISVNNISKNEAIEEWSEYEIDSSAKK